MPAHWITAKRPGDCAGCRKPIPVNGRAWWQPDTRKAYCPTCGAPLAAKAQTIARSSAFTRRDVY